MAEDAVAGDDARAWDERLGWAFGLVADDPAERAGALARLVKARQEVHGAFDRYNAVWRLTLPLGTDERYRHPEVLRAYQLIREARRHSLPDGLWSRFEVGDLGAWPGLPYALLFLEWEARFPEEWTRHAKAWGTKEVLLRDLSRARLDGPSRAKLTDLVEIVVNRPYRCKDREYVRIARAVDSADLRARLDRAAASDDPWACRHAGYVRMLLDRPELPNSRRVWQSWVDADPFPAQTRTRFMESSWTRTSTVFSPRAIMSK
ncbi:hypothetical protein BOQ63_000145 (plasmid) [Streptomyces viridifaciens]|nr:hypothetical protein BOQ63_000145 [Streptomyces viridifaciens]